MPAVAQHRAAAADHDPALGRPLDAHDQPHREQGPVVGLALLHLLGGDRDRVRQLVARDGEQLLAQQLGRQGRLGLVAHNPLRVVVRALRHAGFELRYQRVRAVAVARRQGHERREVPELDRRRSQLLERALPGDAVDLVDDEHRGCPHPCEERGDEVVPLADRLARVDEEADDVDLVERRERAAVGALAQQGAGLVDAGRVEEHDLRGVGRAHAAYLRARRLRPVRDDRHLVADEAVHERRLPDVRPADHRDESRPEQVRRGHRHSRRSAPAGASGRVVSSSCGARRVIRTDTIRRPCMRSAQNSRPLTRAHSPSVGT